MAGLEQDYKTLTEAFDRAGMPWERALVRLGYTRWLITSGRMAQAMAVNTDAFDLAQRFTMPIIAADASDLAGNAELAKAMRVRAGYRGASRP